MVTADNNLRQAREELNRISEHINTCCSCSTCEAQYPVHTLRELVDLIEQIDTRSPVRYRLTRAVLSGLNINSSSTEPTPPGVVLEELMKEKRLTNRALSELTGVSEKTISGLRGSKVLPTPQMARRLAYAGLLSAPEWNQLTSVYKDWLLRQKENT